MAIDINITIVVISAFIIMIIILLSPRKYKVKNKKILGIHGAKAIYQDKKGVKLLVSERFDLKGKPDYIFKTIITGKYIPLEVKSTVIKEYTPHIGDLYQLVAYFLIIEDVYGKRPPYGKLVYANRTFTIKNTRKIRKKVLKTLKEMRNMLDTEGKYIYTESSYIKCRHCICQSTVCEFCEGGF